ncbi:MAG: hypothetical protein VB878_05785, partial [Pirellulaceae bacterium]
TPFASAACGSAASERGERGERGGQVAMPTLNMIDARFNGTGPRLSRSSAGHRAFGCWSLAIIRAWTMADARCSEVVGWEMRHG